MAKIVCGQTSWRLSYSESVPILTDIFLTAHIIVDIEKRQVSTFWFIDFQVSHANLTHLKKCIPTIKRKY